MGRAGSGRRPHILIEDGIAEPGDWWYASPYYIRQEGKRSARRD